MSWDATSWEPYVIAVAVVVSVLILGYVYRWCLNRKWGHCDSKTDLHGKVFIVTGATSGLGKATVESLAKRNATVVLACRNVVQGEALASKLQKKYPKCSPSVIQLDLNSLDSVRSATESILNEHKKIHCLINNAGVYVPDKERKRTADGFEYHFGIHHLGHFLLTTGLLERIKNSAPSRIVTVSSMALERGKIDFDNLNFEKEVPPAPRRGMGFGYRNSKLANALFSWELARRLEGYDVSSFTLCPGVTDTGLFRNSGMPWFAYVLILPFKFLMIRSAKSGAQTILQCATSESLNGLKWGYFRDCKLSKSTYLESLCPETAEKLWEVSEKLVKKD